MEPAKLQEKNLKIKDEFSGPGTGFALDRSELQKINEPEEMPAHVLLPTFHSQLDDGEEVT